MWENKGKNPDFSKASHETECDSHDQVRYHLTTETTALWVDSHVRVLLFSLLFNIIAVSPVCYLFCRHVPSNSYLYTNREGYDLVCFWWGWEGEFIQVHIWKNCTFKRQYFLRIIRVLWVRVIFSEIHLPVDCINPHSQLVEKWFVHNVN